MEPILVQNRDIFYKTRLDETIQGTKLVIEGVSAGPDVAASHCDRRKLNRKSCQRRRNVASLVQRGY
ncbi:hypothetical protein J6590_004233 [Homalodisca vitripennis]|nr:hypothetical protein J6590_004233 [Homalodisca vitripennis]